MSRSTVRLILLVVFVAGVVVASKMRCSKRLSNSGLGPPFSSSVNDHSDAKGLLLSWQHPESRRHAVLEELNGMARLYLTRPRTLDPERDCPAFATRPLTLEKIDWNAESKDGTSPPISKEIASAEAVQQGVRANELSAVWSHDGESVGLVRNGRVICMLMAGQTIGYTRAVAIKSELAMPFDEELAHRTFPTLNSAPQEVALKH